MFGLGMGEIIIILVLALILLGPQKLPDAAKQLGKGLREFRKATEDLKSQFEGELYSEEPKPAKPTLVDSQRAGAADPSVAATAPAGTAGEAPPASALNVPGLEAALVEAPPAAAAPPETAPKAS
jgi:sec-independent protein translocase protein TatB